MTLPSRRKKTPSLFPKLLVSLLAGSLLYLLLDRSEDLTIRQFDVLLPSNPLAMRQWRQETAAACQRTVSSLNAPIKHRKKKEQLERKALQSFVFPHNVTSTIPSNHIVYEDCQNIFIDLGTNIGDSIGYFVDTSLDVCTPIWQNASQEKIQNLPRPHLDVTNLEIQHNPEKKNPLFPMLQAELQKNRAKEPLDPASFCVYGMEGNPTFTKGLQRLENFILGMRPRPIRHLHIHTETVVTATDGPTKLYLDKTSVKENVSRVIDYIFYCGFCERMICF